MIQVLAERAPTGLIRNQEFSHEGFMTFAVATHNVPNEMTAEGLLSPLDSAVR
jgi:hypothetical protein